MIIGGSGLVLSLLGTLGSIVAFGSATSWLVATSLTVAGFDICSAALLVAIRSGGKSANIYTSEYDLFRCVSTQTHHAEKFCLRNNSTPEFNINLIPIIRHTNPVFEHVVKQAQYPQQCRKQHATLASGISPQCHGRDAVTSQSDQSTQSVLAV